MPAAGNVGPYGSCRGCLQKGAAVLLILSMWQTSSDHRALCPFSYPSQLPVPALPLSLPLFLPCWELWSCLRHGEVHGACIDVAVRVRVPRAGAESRCTVVRAYDSIPSSPPSRSPPIPPSPSLESYCNLHICDAFCCCKQDDLFTAVQ